MLYNLSHIPSKEGYYKRQAVKCSSGNNFVTEKN